MTETFADFFRRFNGSDQFNHFVVTLEFDVCDRLRAISHFINTFSVKIGWASSPF